MSREKVLVMGASGMLGSMVASVLSRSAELEVHGTVRSDSGGSKIAEICPGIRLHQLRVSSKRQFEADFIRISNHGSFRWIINAIGIIKPFIHEDNEEEIEEAIVVNAVFPFWLAAAAEGTVLQIGTDCVYSGSRGGYVESDPHDCTDIYGRTKSLGEPPSGTAVLRCSIVGPELKSSVSLLEWFRKKPPGSVVNGYVHHEWNGITTLHFARICEGIISAGLQLEGVQHIVPANPITKFELLSRFRDEFGRGDVNVVPCSEGMAVNRTLDTINPEVNTNLWTLAGYSSPPTIHQMIQELSQYDFQVKRDLQ